jgi:hypothetical protein
VLRPIGLTSDTERAWRKRTRRDARKLVEANWHRVEGVAGALMQRGVLTDGDVTRLLGPSRVVANTTAPDVRYRNEGKIDGVKSKRSKQSRAGTLKVVADDQVLGEVRAKGGAFEAIRDGVSLGTFASLAQAGLAL